MVCGFEPEPRRPVARQVYKRFSRLAIHERRVILAVRDHLTGVTVRVLRSMRMCECAAGCPEKG